MPVTPLHVGPALVIKGAFGERFSLLVFCLAQVVMDIEPVVHLHERTGDAGGGHAHDVHVTVTVHIQR